MSPKILEFKVFFWRLLHIHFSYSHFLPIWKNIHGLVTWHKDYIETYFAAVCTKAVTHSGSSKDGCPWLCLARRGSGRKEEVPGTHKVTMAIEDSCLTRTVASTLGRGAPKAILRSRISARVVYLEAIPGGPGKGWVRDRAGKEAKTVCTDRQRLPLSANVAQSP